MKEHIALFMRHQLGRAPLTNRPTYGWDVECSCGWKLHTNEYKETVKKRFRAHVRSAAVPQPEEPRP